jgi:hypothetical protein
MAAAIQVPEVGQRLVVPVYDEINDHYGKPYYHVISFAVFAVDAKDATGHPKGIHGKFISNVVPGGIGEGPDWGQRTVDLIQ